MDPAPEAGSADGAVLRARMRTDLTTAMRRRDRVVVAVLRGALAALENAEAVPTGPTGPTGPSGPSGPPGPATEGPVAGATHGAGSTEVPRRELTTSEVLRTISDLVAEHDAGAQEREALGRGEDAALLRRQADLLRGYLPPERRPR